MKLRWLKLCDKNGVKTESILQYWDGKSWKDVTLFECKTWQEDKYLQDENAV